MLRALIARAGCQTREKLDTVRRQTPAARMIGEFAVKHLAREIDKRVPGRSTPSAQGTHDPGADATDPSPST